VRCVDIFHSCKIGDGSTDFQHPTVSTRAQAEFVDRGLQEFIGIFFYRTVAFDFFGAHLRIRRYFTFVESLQLNLSRLIDALAVELDCSVVAFNPLTNFGFFALDESASHLL
jgi:hypothetical protein